MVMLMEGRGGGCRCGRLLGGRWWGRLGRRGRRGGGGRGGLRGDRGCRGLGACLRIWVCYVVVWEVDTRGRGGGGGGAW